MSRLVCDYQSALDFLLGRINYERTPAAEYRSVFKLDRMRRLLGLLGDPHLGLAPIHIAGTKGKGSTAAMIASVLRAAGLRTGLYTSPHLSAIEERIAIDGRQCGQGEFVALAAELEEAVNRLRANTTPTDSNRCEEPSDPTFFEVTTAMAFLHFARQRVDAAVLEVGMGGRLDSTNVCRPCVSAITSISFDHTRQLGNTLAAIAREKAGIIKPHVPVVSGVDQDEPRRVIQEVARLQEAPLLETGLAFAFECVRRPTAFSAGERFDYHEPAAQPAWELRDLELGMVGGHQVANAAIAIAVLRQLKEQGWSINEAAIRRGLAAARCPARIEIVRERPTVIVDVAHNVASIQALLNALRQRFAGRRMILIFASSRDKDTAGMLRLLLSQFDEVVLTRYVNNPRAVEPDQLEQLAASEGAAPGTSRGPVVHIAATPEVAWQTARSLAGPDDIVCASGSFYLAAELRPLCTASTLETAILSGRTGR
jgi:dihydrofolate synthase/folylpolyglutamate synthase